MSGTPTSTSPCLQGVHKDSFVFNTVNIKINLCIAVK